MNGYLGSTHYWGRTLRGGWAVKRKTAADRFSRALRAVARWCRTNRHLKVREQWQALFQNRRPQKPPVRYQPRPLETRLLTTGNWKALDDFRYRVKRVWRTKVRFPRKVRTVPGKWPSRRSQTAHVAWDRFALLEQRYPLPPARLAHPLRVT